MSLRPVCLFALITAGCTPSTPAPVDPPTRPVEKAPPSDLEFRELMTRLRSEQIQERDEAADRLKQIGRAAIPKLQVAANDKDVETASRAARLIRIIEINDLLTESLRARYPDFAERVLDRGEGVWAETFLDLDEHGDGRDPADTKEQQSRLHVDLETLAPRAVAAPHRYRSTIVYRVGRRNLRSAIPAVIDCLDDSDRDLRNSALMALGNLKARESIPRIVKLMEEDRSRGEAIKTLGWLRATDQAPAIRRHLSDESGEVRAKSATALGDLASGEAIPDLATLLNDPVGDVRSAAIGALSTLGARAASHDIARRADDKNENESVRCNAIKALGTLLGEEALTALIPHLGDPSVPVAAHALVVILERISVEGPHEHAVVQALRKRLGGTDDLRGRAARGLGGLGAKEAVEQIVPLLKDAEADIRHDAVAALQLLKAADRYGDIATLLKDPDAKVRTAAACCLARLGSFDGVPLLLETAETPKDADVLFNLNQLRSGAAWERLAGRSLVERRSAKAAPLTIRSIESDAGALGFRVSWECDKEAIEERAMLRFWMLLLESYGGRPRRSLALLDAVEALAGSAVILDERTIRIVPPEAALKFWKEWWAARRK